ncbi:MAG TPA: response regulator transcription factor [Pyrinomonadaceae bacterium]|jgi:two-component system NarL family response regulator|nr:response regulator transcription factor [Pyrinomonadaceae bacterium]
MPKTSPISILIADDHFVVRTGLAAVISTQPDMVVVAEAVNGRQAVELFRQHRPDITLMDLRMPEMNGVEAITAIRGEFPKARLIVLTTYDGDEDIYRALQAGARGYLLKDMLREGLLEAVRAVHEGHRRIPAEVANRLAERLTRSELTSREMEVLELIVKGKTNKEIGAELGVAEGTVKIHINNILSKLGVNDRTQAATFALQRGIIHLE